MNVAGQHEQFVPRVSEKCNKAGVVVQKPFSLTLG